jgi:hypothetical protein
MAQMKRICGSCHGSAVVNGHFVKLDNSVKEADVMVKSATLLLVGAWNDKLADKTNPFDEGIEQKGNLSANLQDMAETIRLKKAVKRR